MTTLLEKLELQLKQRDLALKSTEARRWLIQMANNSKNLQTMNIKQVGIPGKRRFRPGMMYFFIYDPKTKEKLPYYDRLPLVFPLEMYVDGFLGLNLHYLAPKFRAQFLDKLMALANNNNMDENTRLKLSYEILDGSKKYKLFKPCLKRYLYNHVKTKPVFVPSNEWELAIFVSIELFVGAKKKEVYKDSYDEVFS